MPGRRAGPTGCQKRTGAGTELESFLQIPSNEPRKFRLEQSSASLLRRGSSLSFAARAIPFDSGFDSRIFNRLHKEIIKSRSWTLGWPTTATSSRMIHVAKARTKVEDRVCSVGARTKAMRHSLRPGPEYLPDGSSSRTR
ncbi:uncharacterized protein ANIA_10968 [Aspergillus nidulans FGSC A4]|uniref:Uncharacterized protein n=1 Tax=Emericella nidulans (strain FGSC A4 / ATCC 38163 / CBS 112.46 / NRRL 194 / M139) TaxID=227321 RepID=C8VBJ2_EMENI|nr:hypothetical protein [Aspergillus nidulans FGSC A4]CBF79527.1 TPA: hypothetical protein ANIA_10968 [Aspergillus nidulans FGSC A4]